MEYFVTECFVTEYLNKVTLLFVVVSRAGAGHARVYYHYYTALTRRPPGWRSPLSFVLHLPKIIHPY